MTIWVLRCKECKNIDYIDVGYNLHEFKRLYKYCKICRKNTFFEILGPKEERK